MGKGPHIFDNAIAVLEDEVFESAGLMVLEQGPDSKNPSANFAVVMEGRNGNAMLVRFGFLPDGRSYARFVGMNRSTGDPTPIHPLKTETGAFVESD